jgi:hypothetical protein
MSASNRKGLNGRRLRAKTRLLQPLRAKEWRMHPYLVTRIGRLKRIADKTTEAFAERHDVWIDTMDVIRNF